MALPSTESSPSLHGQEYEHYQPLMDLAIGAFKNREYDQALQVMQHPTFSSPNLSVALKEKAEKMLYAIHYQKHSDLGLEYCGQGCYQEAEQSLKRAVEFALKYEDSYLLSEGFINLSISYYSLRQYGKAEKCLKHAERNLCKVKDLPRRQNYQALIHSRRGLMYWRLGQYKKSLEYHHKDLRVSKQLEDYNGEARALGNMERVYLELVEHHQLSIEELDIYSVFVGLGNLYHGLGKYQKSIEYFEKARALKGKADIEQGPIYGGLGNVYQSLGNSSKAVAYHERALEIAVGTGDQDDKRIAYANLGNTYCCLKEYQKAFDLQQQALGYAQKGTPEAGRILCDLGVTCLRKGERDKAITYFEQGLPIVPRREQGGIYDNLGTLYFSLGKYEEAVVHHEKALEILTEFKEPLGRGRVNNNLGFAYEKLAKYSLAEKCFSQAIKAFNSVQRALKNGNEGKITVFQEQVKAYRGLESLLLVQGKTNAALAVTDARRSRVLTEAIGRKLPGSFNTEWTTEQIQQLAQRQATTLIVYSLTPMTRGEKNLAVWIISPKGEMQLESLPLQSILEDIKGSEGLLTHLPYAQVRGAAPASMEVTSLKNLGNLKRGGGDFAERVKKRVRARFSKKLTEWYATLIEPIEKFLPQDPKQTVTIIPDGFLAQLPFAAMRDAHGKHLIEKHPISIAPSIKTLQLLETLGKQRASSGSHHALVMGNPDTTNPDKFRPLKISEQEAADVGVFLKTSPETLLIGAQATPSAVMEHAPQAHFIHMACHGEAECKPELDPHSVFEGQLKLAPDPEHTNGNLHSRTISQLDLKAELVFLSACYSGTGKVQQEGVIGNVWSFLSAGALSTVATYWPLEESETTRSMIHCFYQHMLGLVGGAPLNKAQALQQAMLHGMHRDKEGVDQWGVFYLSGLS